MNFKTLRSQLFHHKIITGTLILTSANLITRLIGFYYRIYIARIFSEEAMGILQLTAPVSMLFFSICAVGIQSALSRFTASSVGKERIQYLFSGLAFAFITSALSAYLLYSKAGFISNQILMEPRCASLLRIHALSLPLCTLHSCLNGYFFGKQKASYPAISQILEQISRVGSIYFFVYYAQQHQKVISLSIIVLGSLIGEICSTFFSLIMLFFHNPDMIFIAPAIQSIRHRLYIKKHIEDTLFANKILLSHALPLSCNRVLISVFNSLEATLMPNRLILHGITQAQALSLYGVLTGMAFPLIFFPASMLNAISTLLLPTIAQAQVNNNYRKIQRSILLSCFFCLIIGILSGILFVISGNFLGTFLFHSESAGNMIVALGYLCPLLYIPGMLTSILNGLGHTTQTLLFQIAAILLRLCFVIFLIPQLGIAAYLYGIFFSQLLLTSLIFLALHKYIVYNN